MHDVGAAEREAWADAAAWIEERLSGPQRLAGAEAAARDASRDALPRLTADGIGALAAWRTVRDDVLPTALATDGPGYLAFVGGAPTPVAAMTDAVLSAAAVYGGSELEAGAVARAERAAIRWLCDVLGYPAAAHGAFVSGGSLANLSALVAARHGRLSPCGRPPWVVVAGTAAHASVSSAAAVMGCEVQLAGPRDGVLRAADVEEVLERCDPADVVAVVATAGATNTGSVDALEEIAALCADRGLWLHVDAAYGGAAMLAPAYRPLFAGIDRADSVTLDPHKWLFTPYECGAVLYRDPARARAAHRQQADYLAPVNDESADNPADYGVQLTRRARGLPLWTSLLANGTDAYVDAVERCLATASYAAKRVEASPVLELVRERSLSVVLLRRAGWDDAEHVAWSQRARTAGLGLVTPTSVGGETALRLCFVNPRTDHDHVDALLASLEDGHPGETGGEGGD